MSQDKQFFTTFVAVLVGLGILAVILYFLAGYMSGSVDEYKPKEVVLENIKPAAAGPMSGEQVYQAHCIACHGTGAAGAPKFGDAAAWKPRIAKGIDALLASATNGLNAMPPKGLCMSCSQDELKGAIEYMISNSQ